MPSIKLRSIIIFMLTSMLNSDPNESDGIFFYRGLRQMISRYFYPMGIPDHEALLPIKHW